MDQKTLDALEYTKTLAIIERHCLTPYGHDVVRSFAPLGEVDLIRVRLREMEQMRDILAFGRDFPLGRTEDIRPMIERAGTQGAILEPEDFLVLRETLGMVAALRAFHSVAREKYAALAHFFAGLGHFAELIAKIERALDNDGQIKDSASSDLRRIRNETADARRRVMKALEAVLASRAGGGSRLDDVITQRGERYVVPVSATAYRTKDGIVIDRSQTGQTLFIEPPAAVEWNNRLALLAQDEKREIDRILRELTTQTRDSADPLLRSMTLIGEIDARHAVALFSIKIHATAPNVVDKPEIDLREARHPLLLYYTQDQSTIVPLTLSLGEPHRGIIISGPNTGGKTVSMKTVGLLTLLAQTGIPIPADPRSKVGVFRQIFADIGDEQSIELSLSTFSSHLTKVISAANQADDRTLALLDEVGAGTDPAEGVALAEAIILGLIERGALLIVTTHYSHLKTLALSNPALANASLEFDRVSLRPTYRLRVGPPGSSYAIEISRRLGMPEDILTRAKTLAGVTHRSLEELLSSLDTELRKARADNLLLADQVAKAEELERSYKSRLAEFERERGAMTKSASLEADQIVEKARAEVERVVREIRESQASRESIKDGQATLKGLVAPSPKSTPRGAAIKGAKPTAPRAETLAAGDTVWIESLKREGELVELLGDDRARVRIGNLLNQVDRSDLRRVARPEKTRQRGSSVTIPTEIPDASEIHLRGLTVEDATEELERAIDRAILAGRDCLYVIHGKGEGKLRRALTAFLKGHPAVESVRLGEMHEGGLGVTVANLK